ncbi:MAG: FAD:protein FMN transferase [Dechloromonas sp.]|uniref:FAD:protein FMN transferase n=1 Tax=Candidatus Dechloromonas phosphorivorans TaxID=2899244 RepID=A0A9D7LWV3_9RHOO|nr:FAD:protein FMN transferase [Candidatus Dechloromonas phosphorivorans]
MRHFLILACALLVVACGRTPLQEQQAYVFGTRVEVPRCRADHERGRAPSPVFCASSTGCTARLSRLAGFRELTALNEAIISGRPHHAGPELAELVREAQALSQQSEHLFDPASASW